MMVLIVFLAACLLSFAGHRVGMAGIRNGRRGARDAGFAAEIAFAMVAAGTGAVLLHRLMNWMGP